MKTLAATLFIPAVLFFSGCHSDQNKNSAPENTINTEIVNNPATASSESGKDNVPVFQFEQETHDFGTLMQGEKISFGFKFKNTGKGELLIRAANGSCGCTVAEYPKDPVPPGKGGVINVTFNSEGKEDMQDKTVTLISNTIPNTKVLTITGNIIVPKKD